MSMVHNAFMPTLSHIREHTMPQANDKYKTSLDDLRKQIDRIDGIIADLLQERCEIVAKVGKLKEEQKISTSYIRPRREAMMLRDLIRRFEGGSFPPLAVATIWRTIIGASTAMESPLNLSVLASPHDPRSYFLAREYFGGFLPCVLHTEAAAVMSDIAHNPHTIGIVTVTPGAAPSSWWEELLAVDSEKRPVVFAYLPFLRSPHEAIESPPAFAIGRVEILPTGDDETLFLIAGESPQRREQWEKCCREALSQLSLSLTALDIPASGNALVMRVAGFHYGDATLPTALEKALAACGADRPHVTCLGAYATPYPHPQKM